jgi:hypothetical protein
MNTLNLSTPDTSSEPSSDRPVQEPRSRLGEIGNTALRVFLILLGLGLRGIAALFIGLFSGWIEFRC